MGPCTAQTVLRTVNLPNKTSYRIHYLQLKHRIYNAKVVLICKLQVAQIKFNID